jgi:hypothetical protein
MPGLALCSYQADGVRASELTGVQRRVYVATFGTPPDPPTTTAFVTALRSAADAHLRPAAAAHLEQDPVARQSSRSH